MNAPGLSYVVVVPVKPPAHGKSRMSGLPDEQRSLLARAFALDTVAAVARRRLRSGQWWR